MRWRKRSYVTPQCLPSASAEPSTVLAKASTAWCDKWKQRYPDVHIYPVANQADVAHFLRHHDERVQLAVIGGSETDQLAHIVGPFGHPVFHHAKSSVLVIHD